MIFLDAITCYLNAWVRAFTPGGRRLAPLGARRLLVLLALPFGLVLLIFHWLCLTLDELLYPAYRRVRLHQPVFVLGVPRSGTTFLHRQLAGDPAFTTTSSWEVLLAPAICQRRVIALLAAVDRAFGAPLRRMLHAGIGAAAGPLQGVHEIGLEEAEEDYLALLPAAGCFFALLALPHVQRFRDLGLLSRLPPKQRERLLDHYHRLLQRQVYASGEQQFLSKNAAFASWAPYLLERYPDALLLVCVRDPATALSSQLSSLAGARSLFATFPEDASLRELFTSLYAHWFAVLATCATEQPERLLVIDQSELRGNGSVVLGRIYRRIGREPAQEMATSPPSPQPARASTRHRHSPEEQSLDPQELDRLMGAQYRQLINLARRQADTPALRHAG